MHKLYVGYSQINITPEVFGPMGGHGNDEIRICTEVCDPVYGSCIAISDEDGSTVLLCPCDIINTPDSLTVPAKQALSEATGVPFDNIFLCASHNHHGPSISAPHLEAVQAYYRYFIKQMTKAALKALEDRKPATLQIGHNTVPAMTFVRHYIMNDGTVCGVHSGNTESGYKAHLTESDDQLQLMRFVRQEGRDVLLVNWQSHVTIGVDPKVRTILTADYPGVMRNCVESSLDCHCAFFQGAAGNLVPVSKIEGEAQVPHERVAYGTRLAEYVLEGIKNLSNVSTGPIQVTKQTYTGAIDHAEDHLVPNAKEVVAHYYDDAYANGGRLAYCRSMGFNSIHHARHVITRAGMGESMSMDLSAISIGDVSFITAPFEMFNSNGRFIKGNSPFNMTFICTCTNGGHSYLADCTTFNYDTYEVNSRRMGAGTAEAVADTYVSMLNTLKQK